MKRIYIIKSPTSKFNIWKTYNREDISNCERSRNTASNYPISIPRPSKGQIRIDAITKDKFYYGMQGLKDTDIILVLIKTGHDGIIEIMNLDNGRII
jgi:hypothetical protein